MNSFDRHLAELFFEIGDHKKMVLSTASGTQVTSRMMSVICINGQFLFQTDRRFRKYEQLCQNPNAALCIDNLQIEGVCREIGHPKDNPIFCKLFQQYFPSAFQRYTNLAAERLFVLEPMYIKKWVYLDGEPHEEVWNIAARAYDIRKYEGE